MAYTCERDNPDNSSNDKLNNGKKTGEKETMIKTDNEIIKALNEADGINEVGIYCADCEGEYIAIVKVSDVVDLINRLKAESERLADHNKQLRYDVKKIRTEARNEFAERLKANKIKPEFPWDDFYVTETMIDDLVKEMEKENER